MAGKTSKTARASVAAGARSGAAAGVSVLGEITFIVPLNGGKNAYVRNIVAGRTPNLRTDSEAFDANIKELVDAGHGDRIKTELAKLAAAEPTHNWAQVTARLQEAGVLGAA
jgi:hypothetical protein